MNDHDWKLLNAYLDGDLSSSEHSALEQRLAGEPDLRAQMESLRATVSLMKLAERIPVPRNFTLDPARHGRPARLTLWDRLSMLAVPRTATAFAALSAVLMCVGTVLFVNQSSFGTARAPEAAMMAQEAAAPEAAESGLAADSVEAPPEAAEPAAMAEVATEEEVPPSVEDTARSATAPTPAAEVGGMGGGASATGGDNGDAAASAIEEQGSPPSDFAPLQPTSAPELSAPSALPEPATEVANNMQPYAKGTDQAGVEQPAPVGEDLPVRLPAELLPLLLVGGGGALLLIAVILTLAARRQRS